MSELLVTLFETANLPTVMFDVDNTLNFSHNADIAFLNAAMGYSFTIRTAPEHLDERLTPIDADRYKRWKRSTTSIWTIAPDTAAIAYVNWLLSCTIDVMIVSDHTAKSQGAMTDWLAYWGCPLVPSVGGPGNKARVAQRFGPTKPLVWVDDSPAFIAYARSGVELALLDRVWTPTRLGAHVTLIHTMHDIDALVWLQSTHTLSGG